MKKNTDDNDKPEHISREDIEAKVRELTGDVNDTAQKMSRVAVAGGAATLLLLLILVFLIGRSKGKKKTTMLEIVRI